MRKHRSAILIVLFAIMLTGLYQCKKITNEQTELVPSKPGKYDFKALQSWFDNTWRKPSISPIQPPHHDAKTSEGSDSLPWDFVADRIRGISPDWTLGRGYNYNGFTLYEVPVRMQDDMLFKTMPSDVNTEIDSLSQYLPSSVSYLIVKEAGQEKYGEVMTIIPTYEHLQMYGYRIRNLNLHLDSIYQQDNLGVDFSGKIIFHDQQGNLLRQMTYQRGQLNYLNRYDPGDLIGILPPNLYRAAAPCETVTVVWRECTQFIVNGQVVHESCTPWVPIVSYNVGNCTPEPDGTGGAGGINPAGFDGSEGPLSCKSFNFKPISSSSNWQEAGVRGLQLVGDWFGQWGGFSVKRFGDVYVGIPQQKENGQTISPGQAATYAAAAANAAGEDLQKKYFGMARDVFDRIPASTIALEFRESMQRTLSNLVGAACTVTKYSSSSRTVVNTAVWNGFWGGGGSCN